MKISEIITDKYKLRMPPTVYYDLLADVLEAEGEQEPKTGHWIEGEVWEDTDGGWGRWQKCSVCRQSKHHKTTYCPNCGAKMVEPQESEEE